jgi:glycosyltransferase involved in cell wall biosynthesis
MPRVSILIPSYNHEPYLQACLESVRTQTFDDWEIILVDDGSTDESVALAKEVAKGDNRIRVYVNEQNLGTYGTQARALSFATGNLICVLNSDDLWATNKLASQMTLFDRTPGLNCAYTLGSSMSDDGRANDVHGDWPTEPIQELLPKLLGENRVLASSVMFKRESARFDASLRYSGDWVALLQQAAQGPIGCVPAKLTTWRQHGSNTFKRSEGQVLEEIRVRRNILQSADKWLRAKPYGNAVRNGLGVCALHLSALEVLAGTMSEARRTARLAVQMGSDRKGAMRRLLICSMPRAIAMRRLWPGESIGVRAQAQTQPIEWGF